MTRLVRLDKIASIIPGLGLSGRAAGARPGNWSVHVISVGSIQDDRLDRSQLDTANIEQNDRTEEHLVRPDDVLVSARLTLVKAALVPATTPSRTVADATVLIVRSAMPGLGAYLWWFLTSAHGRRQIESRVRGSTTLFFLPAKSLAEVEVPLPVGQDAYRLVGLIEASEGAFVAATEAARLRRAGIRDAIVAQLLEDAGSEGGD